MFVLQPVALHPVGLLFIIPQWDNVMLCLLRYGVYHLHATSRTLSMNMLQRYDKLLAYTNNSLSSPGQPHQKGGYYV